MGAPSFWWGAATAAYQIEGSHMRHCTRCSKLVCRVQPTIAVILSLHSLLDPSGKALHQNTIIAFPQSIGAQEILHEVICCL